MTTSIYNVKPFSDGHLALYVAKANCCPQLVDLKLIKSQSAEHACRILLTNGTQLRAPYLPETNMMLTSRGSSSGSKSEIVVHGDLDLLLRPQIPLGGLDRGVPEQELDLLQIAAAFAAELGTGSAQVVSTEVLDSDLLR